jgi:hypothetical protein
VLMSRSDFCWVKCSTLFVYIDEDFLSFTGNFYVNFKLLWDPITALIVSHANGQDSHKFWEIFGAQLKKSVACCSETPAEDTTTSKCEIFRDLLI